MNNEAPPASPATGSSTPLTDAKITIVDVAFVGHDGLSSSTQEFVDPDDCRVIEELLTEARRERNKFLEPLRAIIPHTYGDAVMQNCDLGMLPNHEWDNKTTEEQAAWLIQFRTAQVKDLSRKRDQATALLAEVQARADTAEKERDDTGRYLVAMIEDRDAAQARAQSLETALREMEQGGTRLAYRLNHIRQHQHQPEQVAIALQMSSAEVDALLNQPAKEMKDCEKERYERMISNLQHAYLVVHCGSDHMTDSKLMEMIHNTLCDVMGDRELCVWLMQNSPNPESRGIV